MGLAPHQFKTRRTTFLTRSAKRNYNHSKHFLFYKENLFVSQKLDFAYYLYLNLLILLKILQNKSIFYEVKKCLQCPIIIIRFQFRSRNNDYVCRFLFLSSAQQEEEEAGIEVVLEVLGGPEKN